MAITRNYSGPVLMMGVMAVPGIHQQAGRLVGTIHRSHWWFLIYLLVSSAQGIALLIEEKVSMYDPRPLAVGPSW